MHDWTIITNGRRASTIADCRVSDGTGGDGPGADRRPWGAVGTRAATPSSEGVTIVKTPSLGKA